MTFLKTKLALVAAATMLCSVASEAAVIQLASVTAIWQNVVPASGITDLDYQTVGNSVQVRWGAASMATNSKSGYGYVPSAPPAVSVTLGNPFLLGAFTHFNFPIALNTSIKSAELKVSFTITVDGSPVNDVILATFKHNETSNTCSPQPTCSNDIITFDATSAPTVFVKGGVEYSLNVVGFSTNGGSTIIGDFSTVENKTNTASLYASLVGRPIDVSEPETLALLGGALVTLSLAKRRKAA